MSLRWASAQLIYCVVSTPTGPSPLSAERIVMFLFCFISCRRRCCWSVRLEGVFVGLKMVLSCWIKVQMRVSTSLEGSGGRQEDLIRSALGSYSEVSLSPAKNIFKFMSRSNRVVECSRSSGVMLTRGVGMNLRPRPSRCVACGGSLWLMVRS